SRCSTERAALRMDCTSERWYSAEKPSGAKTGSPASEARTACISAVRWPSSSAVCRKGPMACATSAGVSRAARSTGPSVGTARAAGERALRVSAQLVERDLPAVRLVRHVVLEHGDRRGASVDAVRDHAADRRAVSEAAVGEEAHDLEVGVLVLRAPDEPQDEP